MEYEKTASRTRCEQAEYQVSAAVGEVLADANEAMSLDMSAIAGGWKWHALVMLQSNICKYRWGFDFQIFAKTK